MAEVLQNIQHVYEKWENYNPYQSSTGQSSVMNGTSPQLYSKVVNGGRQAWKEKFGNNRKPPTYRRSRARSKGSKVQIQPTVSNLIEFKTAPSVTADSLRPRRPFMGRCCTCMPNSRCQLYDESHVAGEELQDIFRLDTRLPHQPWLTRTFPTSAFVLSRDVSHRYPNVSIAVTISPRLTEAVQRTMQEQRAAGKNVEEATLKKKAKAMIQQMQAMISNRLIRFTGWFLHKFLGRILLSIQVHKGQMLMLKRAAKRELPVIYLPSHRSHLDYILLTFLLFNHDLRAPHVAAGDNLIIPFFSLLMRGLGGFFIRRKLDQTDRKDHLYRAVLQTYMHELLRRNQHFEFFIEGGRTRTGKTCTPKGGLLSVVVDAYLEGVIPDAYIVPVSISYERIIEGSFKNELMGKPKKRETFWRAWLEIWKTFNSQFGNVRVDFCQPFSLKEYLKVSSEYSMVHSLSMSSSLGGSFSMEPTGSSPLQDLSMMRRCSSNGGMLGNEDNRFAIQALADHVIYNCGRCQAVMSTHFVAFLFLHKCREGCEMHILLREAEWLRDELFLRGRDVGFCGRMEDVVNHACLVLGQHLVTKQSIKASQQPRDKEASAKDQTSVQNVFLYPATSLPDVFELAYYANTVSTSFCLEAALASALHSMVGDRIFLLPPSPQPVTVSQTELIRRAAELCILLQYEFTFKPPCTGLEDALEGALEQLMGCDIVTATQEEDSQEMALHDKQRFSRLSDSLSWGAEEDSDEEMDDFKAPDRQLEVQLNGAVEKLKFLLSVLGPYTECYYIVACNLLLLTDQILQENDFVKKVHKVVLERVEQGISVYAESASLETVKNAVKCLKHLKVVEVTKEGSLKLTENYQREETLAVFVETVQSYKP